MMGSDPATLDDYRLLGLHPGASSEEVKRAYRELAKRWHPDRYADKSDWERTQAEEKFKDLQNAYRRIVTCPLRDAFSAAEAPSGKKQDRSAGEGGPGEFRDGDQRNMPFSRRGSGGSRTVRQPREKLWSEAEKALKASGRGTRMIVAALLIVAALGFYGLKEFVAEDGRPEGAPATKAVMDIGRNLNDPASDLSTRVEEALSSLQKVDGNAPGEREAFGESSSNTLGMPETFTLGSPEKDVLRVQGPPDKAVGGRWSYGLSEVRFHDGRVVGYDNFDGRLRVMILPAGGSAADFFTLGSTKEEVLRVQGTPTGVRGSVWHYGFSSVRFSEDRVISYENSFGNLKVRLAPSREYMEKTAGRAPSFFTIGSSTDEVLAVQGTPTSVRGNMWFYDFSDVLFRDGRVGWVNDPAGRLRFVPKEVISQKVPVNPR